MCSVRMNYEQTVIADIFCKCYPEAVSGIEKIRLMKGKEIPDRCSERQECLHGFWSGKRGLRGQDIFVPLSAAKGD